MVAGTSNDRVRSRPSRDGINVHGGRRVCHSAHKSFRVPRLERQVNLPRIFIVEQKLLPLLPPSFERKRRVPSLAVRVSQRPNKHFARIARITRSPNLPRIVSRCTPRFFASTDLYIRPDGIELRMSVSPSHVNHFESEGHGNRPDRCDRLRIEDGFHVLPASFVFQTPPPNSKIKNFRLPGIRHRQRPAASKRPDHSPFAAPE